LKRIIIGIDWTPKRMREPLLLVDVHLDELQVAVRSSTILSSTGETRGTGRTIPPRSRR
jgi:hypothetical protein